MLCTDFRCTVALLWFEGQNLLVSTSQRRPDVCCWTRGAIDSRRTRETLVIYCGTIEWRHGSEHLTAPYPRKFPLILNIISSRSRMYIANFKKPLPSARYITPQSPMEDLCRRPEYQPTSPLLNTRQPLFPFLSILPTFHKTAHDKAWSCVDHNAASLYHKHSSKIQKPSVKT